MLVRGVPPLQGPVGAISPPVAFSASHPAKASAGAFAVRTTPAPGWALLVISTSGALSADRVAPTISFLGARHPP